MAKKRSKKPMSATEAAEQTGSRHKPRKMIAFSPRLYRRLQALAERNHRPVQWEAELAIEAHLEANGISEDAAPASP
jgi:hypothetical protein